MQQLIPFFFSYTALITFILLINNGIILLNIFSIVSYYLYYLYNNYIFWRKFINLIFFIFIFIILIIVTLFIFATDSYADGTDFDLEQTFLEAKTEFYNDKLLFDTKANSFSSWFNDRIAQVEFTKGRPMPQFKDMADSREKNVALEDFLFKRIPVEGNEIHNQACRMLDRVSALEAMDEKIHFLSQTNFDKSEYQKLTLHFFKYRDSSAAVRWYAIQHPNKIIKGMDLKNRYF